MWFTTCSKKVMGKDVQELNEDVSKRQKNTIRNYLMKRLEPLRNAWLIFGI